ncbi:MAG: ABC transporter ATP-binding protein [Reinekea sp.]
MKFYFGMLKLLDNKSRKNLFFLQILFMATAILQVAGIASIAPFIAIISNPTSIDSNILLRTINQMLAFESTSGFLIAYACIVIFLLLVGNSLGAISTWRLLKFSMELGANIQKRIYNNYLDNDYSFFALRNSAMLTNNITQEIPRFVYMVVQPLLNLISQSFVAFLILTGLIALNIKVAVVATILVLSIYLVIYKIIRKKVITYGNMLSIINRKKLQLLDESIAGIKEVKLIGNEEDFKYELEKITEQSIGASAYISLAGDLPKYIVETLVFAAILLLSIYVLYTSGTGASAIGLLSLYAMAGYKLLPSAQTIYKSISLIKANGVVIFELHEELIVSKTQEKENKPVNSEVDISGDIYVDQVSYQYPNSSSKAVNNTTFTIPENEMTAFVGPSGSGKSTIVDIILGLLIPNKGKMLIGNVEITPRNVRSWQKKIGYVPQNIFLLDDTIKKNIAFGIPEDAINIDDVKRAARQANLDTFIEGCPDGYDFIVGERGAKLSGGQKQRIGIARALYKNPSILIFDEATSALDNLTERQILDEICRISEDKTVIMIAHRLSTVEKSNNILVFESGSVVDSGTYNELSRSSVPFKKLISAGLSQGGMVDGVKS